MTDKWEKIEQTGDVWALKDIKTGDELIGYFMGVTTEVGPNSSNLYEFRLEDGSFKSVWGTTLLDNRFKTLIEGQKVKIVYKGKHKNPKTGREYHDFDVFKSAIAPPQTKTEDEAAEELSKEVL